MFCTSCLPNKLPIPKMNNEKHRVCMKCYNILTGKVKPKKEDPSKYSPPENYKKRVAALKEKEVCGIVSASQVPKPQGGAQVRPPGMSQADWDIQQRLEKLREKTPTEVAAGQTSEVDIADRLAKMKGMDPARYNKQPVYQPPDRRTQQEQMNELLDEISNEVELDSRLPDPVLEISARLARLKEPIPKLEEKPGPDDNNLNKPSTRDSQSFSQNIESGTGQTGPGAVPGSLPKVIGVGTSGKTDPVNEVSPEEMRQILNAAAQELEQEAQRALKGLEDDKEIMKKLQEVKERRKQSSTNVNKDEIIDSESDNDNEDNDEENEEKLAADYIRRAMEENKLDEAAAKDGVDISDSRADKKERAGSLRQEKKRNNTNEEIYDPDELPYCSICTNDAKLRCLGCDYDLFCRSCFREAHQIIGLPGHKSIDYIPPKIAT
ncbi:abscission/NoCut checkpoint regulator-like isoform X2 [Dreissena polymorpha]|nr:abscission/NoCut checkpoint regulator-like isoform X2 [Dreissena polymorpha]